MSDDLIVHANPAFSICTGVAHIGVSQRVRCHDCGTEYDRLNYSHDCHVTRAEFDALRAEVRIVAEYVHALVGNDTKLLAEMGRSALRPIFRAPPSGETP